MDGEYEKTQLLTKKIVSTREKWMTLNYLKNQLTQEFWREGSE